METIKNDAFKLENETIGFECDILKQIDHLETLVNEFESNLANAEDNQKVLKDFQKKVEKEKIFDKVANLNKKAYEGVSKLGKVI